MRGALAQMELVMEVGFSLQLVRRLRNTSLAPEQDDVRGTAS